MKEVLTAKTVLQKWQGSHIILIGESFLIGGLTGLVITAFRKAIDFFSEYREVFYRNAANGNITFALQAVIFAAGAGLLIGYIIKKYPMTKGGGISQIKGNFMRRLNLSPWPELPLKFFSGVLNIGAGLSVGREGPSVQIGAYIGTTIEKIGRQSHLEKMCLITSGAAAGLAATFAAPFAGVIFAMEDLHQYLSPILLTCIITGAFTGNFIASLFFKQGAVFHFEGLNLFPIKYLGYLAVLGIITALIGHIFKKSIYKSQKLYTRCKIPTVLRPIIPYLVSVPVCIFLPLAASGGDALIELLFEHQFKAGYLVLLLILKLLFTGLSSGSGAVGGIFVPLLTCGALTGVLFSKILIYFNLIEAHLAVNLMIFAMAGFFTTVIKAPLTAVVLLVETTGYPFHTGGLLVTVLFSYVTANLLRSPATDDVLLQQILSEQHNVQDTETESDEKELFEVCINPESFLDGKEVREVIWPKDCLLVGLNRGEKEFIPKGDTQFLPGNRLTILTRSKDAARDISVITAMASKEE